MRALSTLLLKLVCFAVFLLSGTAQSTNDPYLSGLRWSEAATTAEPWLARRLTFAGQDQAVWAGRAVGSPGASLYVGSDAGSLSTAFDVSMVSAIGRVEVAAGQGLGHLYSAVQYPGTGTGRETELTRHSAFQSAPVWQRSLAPEVMGGALVASAGGRLFCARFDPQASLVWLDRLDPQDGHSIFATSTPALGLGGLDVSESGERIALALGNRVVAFDDLGNGVAAFALASSTEAFGLSADGSTLVAGGMGNVRVWREGAAGFALWKTLDPGGPWLATRTSLSADGKTLGVGYWNSSTGASIRFQMWDLELGLKLHDVLQSGVSGGLQNFPEVAAVSYDGQRMACGAWGSGGPHPQLTLLDRDQVEPVLSSYLPGSVTDLAIDRSGTRIAVGVKAGHANQFSTTGYVQLFDTGERDLQLVGSLQAGANFQLTSRLPGSLASLFVFGSPLHPPAAFNGFSGLLGIDPAQPYALMSAPADSSGRADLFGFVPGGAAFVGLSLDAQAVFAGPLGWQFSDSVQTLTIL